MVLVYPTALVPIPLVCAAYNLDDNYPSIFGNYAPILSEFNIKVTWDLLFYVIAIAKNK